MFTSINEFKKYITSINEDVNYDLKHALIALSKQTDEEIIEHTRKELAKINSDPEYQLKEDADFNDPAFIKRFLDEWKHDVRYAINEIEDFCEGMSDNIKAKLIADSNLLGLAVSSYASNGDPMEFLPEDINASKRDPMEFLPEDINENIQIGDKVRFDNLNDNGFMFKSTGIIKSINSDRGGYYDIELQDGKLVKVALGQVMKINENVNHTTAGVTVLVPNQADIEKIKELIDNSDFYAEFNEVNEFHFEEDNADAIPNLIKYLHELIDPSGIEVNIYPSDDVHQFESKLSATGVTVSALNPADTEKLKELFNNSDLHSEFDPTNNSFFFAEEPETMSALETEIMALIEPTNIHIAIHTSDDIPEFESKLSPKQLKKLILENDEKRQRFYCLSSGTKINTKNPLKNEYVSGWENSNRSDKTVYYLIRTPKYPNPIIISSSGGWDSLQVGSKLDLYDDINGTTRFPKSMIRNSAGAIKSGAERHIMNRHGAFGEILCIANGAEEIKNFIPGSYTLMVLK